MRKSYQKQKQNESNKTKHNQTTTNKSTPKMIYIIIENVDTLCLILYSLPGRILTPLEKKQTKHNHNKVMDPTKDKENKITGNNKPQ